MYRLFVHDDAQTDLEELWSTGTQAAARIAVLLQELEGDQDLLDRLTQHEYYGRSHSADFHVSKWVEQWRQGRDLWRLKVWDLEGHGLKYRIIYAFVPKRRHYHVLAIAPREFNYDSRHPLTQRIRSAYGSL